MGMLKGTVTASLLAVLGLAGCQGTAPHARPQPVTRAPAAKPEPAPASAASEPAQVPSQPAEPVRDDSAVVVDPGVEDGGAPTTLAAAAKTERERRARAGQPVAVITDKTLPKYARQGQITVADPKDKDKNRTEKAAAAEAAAEILRDEQYWRSRGLEIRLRWKQAADDVKDLEQRSVELRQQFYGENDPLIRDNRIKPEWDRVLDRLRQARLDVTAATKELAQYLEEGRVAGAQPGWLREGEDLEPPGEARKEPPPPAQAIEPPVLEPPTGDDRPPGGWRGWQ
jgi:hypothetical protein